MLLTITFARAGLSHHAGHDVAAMECVGFMVTLRRGAEWPPPKGDRESAPDFPTAESASTRPLR